jgi:hypothetical protein
VEGGAVVPYSITITGLKEAQRLLGANFDSAMQSATKAIALQVENEIAPYPPATEANSPGNPKGKWYERGYGPRWQRKDGSVGGSKTSQMLGRRWGIRPFGRIGTLVGNTATYAPFVHSQEDQAAFHGRRGWKTDHAVLSRLLASGRVRAIVLASIRGAFRRR